MFPIQFSVSLQFLYSIPPFLFLYSSLSYSLEIDYIIIYTAKKPAVALLLFYTTVLHFASLQPPASSRDEVNFNGGDRIYIALTCSCTFFNFSVEIDGQYKRRGANRDTGVATLLTIHTLTTGYSCITTKTDEESRTGSHRIRSLYLSLLLSLLLNLRIKSV